MTRQRDENNEDNGESKDGRDWAIWEKYQHLYVYLSTGHLPSEAPPATQSHNGFHWPQPNSASLSSQIRHSPSPVLLVFVFDFCLLLLCQVWVCPILHIYTATTRSSSSFTTHLECHSASWVPWTHSCLSKPCFTSLKYPSLVTHCSLGKIQTPHHGLQGPPQSDTCFLPSFISPTS